MEEKTRLLQGILYQIICENIANFNELLQQHVESKRRRQLVKLFLRLQMDSIHIPTMYSMITGEACSEGDFI